MSPGLLALCSSNEANPDYRYRRLALPHFDHALEKAEKAYLEDLAREPDMHEGIRAFVEKRPPRYGGAR